MKYPTSINDDALQYIERNWKKVPLPVLAKEFSMTVLQLTSLLRQKGIISDIQPWELEYIHKNINRMPASKIRKTLCLTENQFSLIVNRNLGKKRRTSLDDMLISEATEKTRWLIEEELRFSVNDHLPRKIQNKHFVDNDLYDCIRFAETEKKKDSLYKHFTATAFLVCQAYPHTFRPFQFRHAKTNEYFRGSSGRKHLINAVRWIIEKKMGHKPEQLPVIGENKYFLRSADMQFFGIGNYQVKEHFSSHNEFRSAILKEYQVVLNESQGGTAKLRKILTDSNRYPEKCEVPGCYFDDTFGVEIHHIVPRAHANQVKTDINCIENLVVLCPNHHRIADKFDWKNVLTLKDCGTWIETILRFIREKEEMSEQVNEKAVKTQVIN